MQKCFGAEIQNIIARCGVSVQKYKNVHSGLLSEFVAYLAMFIPYRLPPKMAQGQLSVILSSKIFKLALSHNTVVKREHIRFRTSI